MTITIPIELVALFKTYGMYVIWFIFGALSILILNEPKAQKKPKRYQINKIANRFNYTTSKYRIREIIEYWEDIKETE